MSYDKRYIVEYGVTKSCAWAMSIAQEMKRAAARQDAREAPAEKRVYPRVTSRRSYALKERDYSRLVNETMPENVRKIEAARDFGDLSENAEYQYAKDEQRALMQRQAAIQAELDAVRPDDFNDATTDEVMPGVSVVAETSRGKKTFTILGEWDNDLDRGVISSRARVATNMLGKKVGDSFELPDDSGRATTATILEIRPLSDDIRDWMSRLDD